MSQEAVEIVRDHIEAFRRGDEAVSAALLDADVILDTTRGRGSLGTVARGHAEVVRETNRFIGAFEDYDYEVERTSELGDGTVAVVMTERGHGKGSGAFVEHTAAAIYNVLDGKIVRITGFATEREALQAAGLSE